MRRACKNTEVLSDSGNMLLSFGFDFCAEHEWGISGIERALGISGDKDDLSTDRYAVTAATETNVHLIEADTKPGWQRVAERRLYLLGGRVDFWKQTPEQFVSDYRESCPRPGEPEALWDERTFMFSVPIGHKHEKVVRKIHAAMLAGDALVYLASSGTPFGGSGLVIVRRSTIPKHLTDQMEAGFRDQKALRDAAEATGIRERVEAWGRERAGPYSFGRAFFALSPKWMFKGRKAESKHPVIYWLNPYDQQNNNFGWFTVEELEQWMEGKGPIPKRAAA